VTQDLRQQKAAGATVVGLALRAPSSGEGWAGFNSDEAPGNRPELVVAQVSGPAPAENGRGRLGFFLFRVDAGRSAGKYERGTRAVPPRGRQTLRNPGRGIPPEASGLRESLPVVP
jgi:hypothetical protein